MVAFTALLDDAVMPYLKRIYELRHRSARNNDQDEEDARLEGAIVDDIVREWRAHHSQRFADEKVRAAIEHVLRKRAQRGGSGIDTVESIEEAIFRRVKKNE